MKLTGLFALLGALSCIPAAQALETIIVDVDDLAGLNQAISDANARPTDIVTRIYAPGEIALAPTDSLTPIKARINIRGGVFREVDGGPDRLFIVESTGILSLGSSVFSDWSRTTKGPVLFENYGSLLLTNVLFDSVYGYAACGTGACAPAEMAVIHNAATGNLTLDQVLVVDSNTESFGSAGPANRFVYNEGVTAFLRSQFHLSPGRESEPLLNAGFMRLRHVTFMVRNPVDVPTLSLLAATAGANAQAVNSVFDGFTGDWCASVRSAGNNLTTASDCRWSAPGDLVGAPTGLVWRKRHPAAPDSGHFDLVPMAGSPAVDSANGSWCPADNANWDGDGDGVPACDRGAWELRSIRLAEGGINGFYYNPNEDGHYVYVQETGFTTLVMWNTFDAEGNHAWIYGIGEVAAGRSVIGKAYINRSGGLTPDGFAEDVEAEPWGYLEVELESCIRGLVNYRSVLPEFGVGQFPITRLAYVKQLGCIDPSQSALP